MTVTEIPQKISIMMQIYKPDTTKNIQILMRIIDAVLICAREGIALRTHRDNLDDPFVRDNNFIAILKGFTNYG